MTQYIYTCKSGDWTMIVPDVPGATIPGGLPAWIDATDLGDTMQIEITNAPTAGTFTYNFTVFTLKVIVTELCVENYNPCCKGHEINIGWINNLGGFQNWIFDGIITSEFRHQGGSQTFMNENQQMKYSDAGDNYDGEICECKDISKHHVDIISNLRMSIQAWIYNTESNAWDIPIIIDRDSFTKYNSKDRFFNISLRFFYAEKLQVQTQ